MTCILINLFMKIFHIVDFPMTRAFLVQGVSVAIRTSKMLQIMSCSCCSFINLRFLNLICLGKWGWYRIMNNSLKNKILFILSLLYEAQEVKFAFFFFFLFFPQYRSICGVNLQLNILSYQLNISSCELNILDILSSILRPNNKL